MNSVKDKLPRPPSSQFTSIDVSGNLLAQANVQTRQIEIWDVNQQRPIKSLTGCGLTKDLKIDHNCVSGIERTTQHGFYNSVLKVIFYFILLNLILFFIFN